MWSGSVASIPNAWALCDGSNGTPDLRGRFIRGAGGDLDPGDTGGGETSDFTPEGTISTPVFTGSPLGNHNHGAGTLLPSAHAGAAVADHDPHTHEYSDVIEHTHPVDITDPGHNHTQNAHTHVQDAHGHSVTDPGHNHTQNSHNHTQDAHTHTQDAHTHTQNAHNHGITDPGHVHDVNEGQTDGDGSLFDKSNAADSSPALQTASATTGITINNATAVNQNATATNQNTTATNQATTATNNANTTGLTVDNATATNQNATATNNANTTGITGATQNPVGSVAVGETEEEGAPLTHDVTQPNDHTMGGNTADASAGTPAGSISTPVFTGTPGSVSAVPVFYALCFIMKL